RWKSVTPRLRAEEVVMHPANMRNAFSTNASFASTLIHKIMSESWTFSLIHEQVDSEAGGDLAYYINTPTNCFTFGARSVVRPDTGSRVGRIRENVFDFYGCVYQGKVDIATLDAEHTEQVNYSWKGRTRSGALGWTFANRSA